MTGDFGPIYEVPTDVVWKVLFLTRLTTNPLKYPFADLDCKARGQPLSKVDRHLRMHPSPLLFRNPSLNQLNQFRYRYTGIGRKSLYKVSRRTSIPVAIPRSTSSLAHGRGIDVAIRCALVNEAILNLMRDKGQFALMRRCLVRAGYWFA